MVLMDDSDLFAKTARGLEEIRARSGLVPQRVRSLLILVDGSSRLAQLRQAAERIGAPDNAIETLLSLGLIERQQPAPPRTTNPPGAASRPVPQQAASAAGTAPASAPASGNADPQKFLKAQKFMNDTIVDALGIRALMFTLKLEKCFTQADLEALLPDYERLLSKSRGDEIASALIARLRDLLR